MRVSSSFSPASVPRALNLCSRSLRRSSRLRSPLARSSSIWSAMGALSVGCTVEGAVVFLLLLRLEILAMA